MIIIFAGTPAFAAIALAALLHSSHQVVAVYTQPDRPAGRGLHLTPSPVKTLALQHHLPIYQPTSLISAHEQALLAGFNADAMVVAAYGMLIPTAVLAIPRYGCINIHPSLLPRWRGAAPIQRTLCAGDKITGVTIMQMDATLDTGPILLQRQCNIEPDETTQTLHNKLATIGAQALIETLDLLDQKKITPISQNHDLATYAKKISKSEALLDWSRPAIELEQTIRAFNPWPVAYTTWHGKNLRIWRAKALAEHCQKSPRTVLRASANGIDIATGVGTLRLLEIQLPGSKILPIANFYHANKTVLIAGHLFV